MADDVFVAGARGQTAFWWFYDSTVSLPSFRGKVKK